jgi:hypothetical protein
VRERWGFCVICFLTPGKKPSVLLKLFTSLFHDVVGLI